MYSFNSQFSSSIYSFNSQIYSSTFLTDNSIDAQFSKSNLHMESFNGKFTALQFKQSNIQLYSFISQIYSCTVAIV